MALTGDALQAILATATEASRQAMVTVGETLANSINQKSTEDHAGSYGRPDQDDAGPDQTAGPSHAVYAA